LIETLAALRATFPGLQFVVDDVRADGGQVAARIRLTRTTGIFLGMPLGVTEVPWGPIDLFRVEHGKIAEHWGVPANAPHLAPVNLAPVDLDGGLRRGIRLERRTYDEDASWREEIAPGTVFMLGQTGRLTVAIDDPAATPARLIHAAAPGARPGTEVIGNGVNAILTSDDLVMLPSGTRYTTANDGAEPAEVVVLTLTVPTIPNGAPMQVSAAPPGIAWEVLAIAPAAKLPENAVVQIGRMTLGDGAGIPLHATDGPEVLTVESGALALYVGGELAWVRRDAEAGTFAGTHSAIARSSDGVTIPRGATATYRATGAQPTSVLVLTIRPGD
jgi:hypothetical protein